jgi:hypothetical protein
MKTEEESLPFVGGGSIGMSCKKVMVELRELLQLNATLAKTATGANAGF